MKQISSVFWVIFLFMALFINNAYGFAGNNPPPGGGGKDISHASGAAQKALDELQGGRPDEAVIELKNVRQYTREIRGEAASMKLQKANQAIKETMRILAEEKDNKKAIEVLAPAVQSLHEINAEATRR
ncbi:MAG: hypothetical protein WCH01_20830 [Methylococcaceae bacterium]